MGSTELYHHAGRPHVTGMGPGWGWGGAMNDSAHAVHLWKHTTRRVGGSSNSHHREHREHAAPRVSSPSFVMSPAQAPASMSTSASARNLQAVVV